MKEFVQVDSTYQNCINELIEKNYFQHQYIQIIQEQAMHLCNRGFMNLVIGNICKDLLLVYEQFHTI